MFQAFFNSLSGLFSFSRSLDTVSNNVANMNTPGFRGSDSFFANVNGGMGTSVTGSGLRGTQGDLRQTGTPTDVAVDGTGYFVLRSPDGSLFYTRGGQFHFNNEGLLVDTVTGYEVMAIDSAGNLNSIDVDGHRSLDPVATTIVNLNGSVDAPALTVTNTVTSSEIQVYDAAGTVQKLIVTLTSDGTAPLGYSVVVKDKDGNVLSPANTVLQFDELGRPTAGHDSVVVTLHGTEQHITLNFTGGQFGGIRTGAGNTLGGQATNGHGTIALSKLSFDEKGVLQYEYASEKVAGPQLALAAFKSETDLELVGNRLIAGRVSVAPDIGRAGEGVFGGVVGGSLELANVDLTQEFADMIIIQRGYQASSRVMTVSNEMIEQLYNSTRG